MIRLLILALLALRPLSAQIATATHCVHQAGDNSDWARPGFDDRQWSQQFPEIGSPFVWTRCRIDVSVLPQVSPIFLGVLNQDPWELFVNGVPAGSHGDLRTGLGTMSLEHRAVPSAAGDGPTFTVALRQVPGRSNFRFLRLILVAGSKDALVDFTSKRAISFIIGSGPNLLGGVVLFTIGFLLLLLFLFSKDSRQRELFWFSILALSVGSIRIMEFAFLLLNSVPTAYLWMCIFMLNMLAFSAMPRVFFALAGKRLSIFYYWLSAGLAGFFLLRAVLLVWGPITWVQRLSATTAWIPFLALPLATSAVAAFWPLWKVPRHLRLASILCLLLMSGNVARQVAQLPFLSSLNWLEAATTVQSVLILVSLCGLFVVIAQRHRQVSLDRAELQGEMKSAQEVQRLLTASTRDVAPWAAVDVAYLPAKEVGGDFFFCRQTAEGQLVVVGDVSGKGLRAAMLASVALGSLRSLNTNSPARLLEGLNSALLGQAGGGFVTCVAALLQSDGQIIVANAGHLSPYAGGEEISGEAGLPLGLVADTNYQETSIPANSITLLSDGVVEAENAQRELFGFDRTREISGQSAKQIAEAAQAWGQNDDITVVMVRRLAK